MQLSSRSAPIVGASCAEVSASLDEFVDGAADAITGARVASHLGRCPVCGALFARYQQWRQRAGALGRSEQAPHALRNRITTLLRGVRGSSTI